MAFLLLAKAVVAAHFGFVAFVYLGGYLFAKNPRLVWVHGACIAYAILVTVVAWPCPLTVLEQWLLAQGGAPVYAGEFLPYYLWSRFGLTGSEVPVAIGMIVSVLAANVRPYWLLFQTHSR